MEGVVLLIIALLVVFLLLAFFWGTKLARKGAARLPRLEGYFKLPGRTVRWGAFVFGSVLYTVLIVVFFYRSDWHEMTHPNLPVRSIAGLPDRPHVPLADIRDAKNRMAKLILDARFERLDLEDPKFTERARAIGFRRLDDLVERMPGNVSAPVFAHVPDDMVPAFDLFETIPFETMPVWRGWLSKALGNARIPEMQALLWCGFNLSEEPVQRLCVLGLPVPIFQRLYLNFSADASIPVQVVGPMVFVRLDASGGRVSKTVLTHRNYKSRERNWQSGTAEWLPIFQIGGATENIPWDDLLSDQIPVEMTAAEPERIESTRDLWTKRELLGRDRWLFADRGTPGFTPQERMVARPLLMDIAHDFLGIGQDFRTDQALRTWVGASIGAVAYGDMDDDTSGGCEQVMTRFRQSFVVVPEQVGSILPRHRRQRHSVFIGKDSCPSAFLGLLFFNDWAKR